MEYLARAEKLKEIIDRDTKKKPVAVGGGDDGSSSSRNGRGGDDSDDEGNENGDSNGKNKKEDAETKKMKDALSSVIVSEKPNVHWEDIAGLVGISLAWKTVESTCNHLSLSLIRTWQRKR